MQGGVGFAEFTCWAARLMCEPTDDGFGSSSSDDDDDDDEFAEEAEQAAAQLSDSSSTLARALSRLPSSLAALVDERVASKILHLGGTARGRGGAGGEGGANDETDENLDSSSSNFQDALSEPPLSAADAEAMFRMLDSVSARLRSLEREVRAARAIVEGACPEVASEKSFVQRLHDAALPLVSSFSWGKDDEEEEVRYSRSTSIAVAAAATAVIAAFVAVRGASNSANRSRV